MNQTTVLLISFFLPIVVMTAVTTIVSRSVRNSPTTVTWKATREGVLFIVTLRRWQRVLIRTGGITTLALGCLIFLVALTDNRHGAGSAMGIAGICMVVGDMLLIWLAHGMARLRLEVTPDTVWAFRMAGAPRLVSLSEISQLAPLYSSNYGGILARSATKNLFYATRIMLGYAQLIDHLRTHRPDLTIPDASWPLSTPAQTNEAPK
ncbi:MAG: hypothetical protein ABI067_07440 [Leifsonia sp.]